MSKVIEIGKEAREKLAKGIDVLADAVVSTLGPNGRNVVYIDNGQVVSTKDGVSVAKHITELEDPIENLGVQLIKQAAVKTGDSAGDGTTTSTLLAREIVKQGLNRLNDGANAIEIKRGIDSGVKVVLDALKNRKQEITSKDQLKQIATISANNDSEIGELISKAMEKVGKEGVVYVEESKTGDTYLEVVEGMQFDRGFKSPYFVTNNSTMSSVLNDCLILIADHKFSQVKELLPLLSSVSESGKSLLIIADDIDGEALSTLIVNKMRGTLKVCAVKAPDFGDRKKLILDDIAVLTGGTVFSSEKGMKLDRFNSAWFGSARVVTIDKEKTTIVDGKGDEKALEDRVLDLQSQIDNAQTPFEREKLQDRLAKFSGGVAIVHVGGSTETELKEKKDRVDDALQATKCALEDGIVPGGGIALLYARESLSLESSLNKSEDFLFGEQIVYKSCGKPFEQILTNAGKTISQSQIISEYKLFSNDLTKHEFWMGYNIKNDAIVDMKESGIIDPHKVTKTALSNAASIASTILLTECVIVDKKEETKQTPGIDPSMFG
jgi:chaperonin GroEL